MMPQTSDRRFHGLDLRFADLVALKTYAKNLYFNPRFKSSSKLSGDKHSIIRGRGMDFDEVRPYQMGDDIRSMDWRVTARTGKPHTKLFREEKEQPVYFCLDLGETMQFGTQVTFKATLAAQIAALLAWKHFLNHDRLGGLIYNQTNVSFLNPKPGNRGILPLLKEIIRLNTQGLSLLNKPCENAITWQQSLLKHKTLIKQGCKIFLISDFITFSETEKQLLSHLACHNQLTLLHIYDPLEAKAPKPNRYVVSNGKERLQFDSSLKSFKAQYHESFLEHVATLKKFSRERSINFLSFQTNDDITQLQGVK